MHPNQMVGHLNPVKCTRMRKRNEWKWKISIDEIYIIQPPPRQRFCLLSIWMVCIASTSPWIYGEIEFWTCICTTNTKSRSRNTNKFVINNTNNSEINRVPQVNRLAKKQDGDETKKNRNKFKKRELRESRYFWWTQSTHTHSYILKSHHMHCKVHHFPWLQFIQWSAPPYI